MQPRLNKILRYPVKSAGGVAPESARVGTRGFVDDRRWMVVEPDGTFLTQRTHPRLALLRPELHADGLDLGWRHPDDGVLEWIEVERPGADAETIAVEIWGDRVAALDAGPEVAAWLSRRLETRCRLVYMPDEAGRSTGVTGEDEDRPISFVDSKPFLLIGRASLRALNSRLDAPLEMNRFRPNLVVDGTEPFAEDEWHRIRIGEVTFLVVEPCTRCSVTTVDQRTAERGREPLQTLAEFRRTDDGDVAFGQYLVHEGRGRLHSGQPVEVLE